MDRLLTSEPGAPYRGERFGGQAFLITTSADPRTAQSRCPRQFHLYAGRVRRAWILVLLILVDCSPCLAFVLFESGQVRPLALSPDRAWLFAVNTPDNRLELLQATPRGLVHDRSVSVGLEPVAVAVRTDREIWVVNHLSDSVSIVKLDPVPRVVRTLLVGDEPRDIVFAGPNRNLAFITAAHRGQNRPGDPQLTTPAVGRADVWVFDATDLGEEFGGTPRTIVTLFADTPRSLAVTPDGRTVYAAAFHSGNRTTVVPQESICDRSEREGAPCEIDGQPIPDGPPGPGMNVEGVRGPRTGLIVRFNPITGIWEDEAGQDWSYAARLTLPDLDVFSIDAFADPPRKINALSGMGTILYNMIVNPVSGDVYVSNTDALNLVRFESNVRGRIHRSQITILTTNDVIPRQLNKHIDYSNVPSPSGTKERSLALPTAMAVSEDGRTLYLAALGSGKIGVLAIDELLDDSFVPTPSAHIPVTGSGPSGLALDEERGRLYVLTRFDNAVSVVDIGTREEIQHLPLFNPEPDDVIQGRAFLYDANLTSSNGEASCAGCHVFGDFDSLAWDLGDPDAPVLDNPNRFVGGEEVYNAFHPLKGPMTTQTLRGLATHGPMHWRGDRTGGFESEGDPDDEVAAFRAFNSSFVTLLGREAPLDPEQLSSLTSFALQIRSPPNPIRSLENVPPAFDFHSGCGTCHVLDPARGFFGTDGSTILNPNDGTPQIMKVPHLRNFYQKIGMFVRSPGFGGDLFEKVGDQVRGFGHFNDGSGGPLPPQPGDDDMVDFLLAFPSDFAPIVGQQVTISRSSGPQARDRLRLLGERADAAECELVVKGVMSGESRGWIRTSAGRYASDRVGEIELSENDLLELTIGEEATELTFTCAPPGEGLRIGIDRDLDSFLDRDEVDAGSDPGDAESLPGSATPTSAYQRTPTPPPIAPACVGDCNTDGSVTIDEILTGISMALGTVGSTKCPGIGRNGIVEVNELIVAVRMALEGCAQHSTR